MSFFSTAEILKSMISGELVKEIVNSSGFKEGLIGFDINDYLTDEVIETITEKYFKTSKSKRRSEQ